MPVGDCVRPRRSPQEGWLSDGRQEITREEAIKLWSQKRKVGWQPWEPQWLPPPSPPVR